MRSRPQGVDDDGAFGSSSRELVRFPQDGTATHNIHLHFVSLSFCMAMDDYPTCACFVLEESFAVHDSSERKLHQR
jgi:hypothetical protein